MSFPGSYNIRYYYGDTLEFRIFPKNASGEIFDLSTFTNARFTLAENRNTPVDEHISCFASFSLDRTNLLCTIRPEDSELINPDLQYVYDVEISKPGDPYDIVYTLLTGSVTVIRDVTRPGDIPPPPGTPVPNNPTNLSLDDATTTSLEVSWQEPTEGPTPSFYKVAIIPFTEDQSEILSAISETDFEPLNVSQTSFIFEDLEPNTEYSVIVVATNAEDQFDEDTILTNEEAFQTADDSPPPPSVNNPEDITFTSATETTITIGWQPPTGGIEPSAFRMAILPFTTDEQELESALNISTMIVSGSTFSQTFTGLQPATGYSVVIVSLDSSGNFNFEGFLTNEEPYITASEPVEPPPEPDFLITADGTTAYLVDGVSNDTITLVRGQSYVLEIDASGNPLWIQESPSPYDPQSVYNDGIEGNGTAVGTITWTVSESAPSTLYYVSQANPSMTGIVNIIDEES